MRKATLPGIGLAIVRYIAALHEAAFEMEVDPGHKTEAILSFTDGDLPASPNRGKPPPFRRP